MSMHLGPQAPDITDEQRRHIEISGRHLQRIALRAIRASGSRGLTTHELSETVRIHRDAIQPRTSELRDRGLIRDSGGRRENVTGKLAIVWIATTGGAA